ncbi:MAG: hypothetical protein A2413_02785 [Treponema sp. RIFOXYC1_FULL_61_9]|nr:MAG: hypothetical protein A2413_02785 [Treponema sp. RIFOXYC1_FULL_61_9]
MTIAWKGSSDVPMESFYADVEVWSMNNRDQKGTSVSNRYRMAMKTIEGVQYVRLDFDPALNEGRSRSIVSDNTEMVMFDTVTEAVEYRIPITRDVSSDLSFLDAESGISRMDLAGIRSTAARLYLDIAEEADNRLSLKIPSSMILNQSGNTRVSTKVSFDMSNDTLEEIEIVDRLEDGTVVTATTQPVYKDFEGTPIKVGTVSIIDSKAAVLVDGFTGDVPIYECPEDVPLISQETLGLMQSEGSIHPIDTMVFGNPADLSYQASIIEVYSDVGINATPDSLFKLLRGGN